MNRKQNTGLMISATNREEKRVVITVIGKYFMNSPIIPGQKISGIKAQTVVRVDAVTAIATSFVASSDPFSAFFPVVTVPVNILDNYDRIIDKHTKSQNKAEKNNKIECYPHISIKNDE